ncbi:3-dehydroquinate synthase [Pseudoflavonifractor phocaeensis]|uniref:3-dehydroquinate synthase n=1 Tax=Pseudoflavonifractor phocaeensis TaxID=1870988 RepID=UPI00313EECB9
MKTLRVSLQERSYDIQIAPGLLTSAGDAIRAVCPRATRLFVVTDSNVAPLYLSRLIPVLERCGFETACQELPAGEASKSAKWLSELWEAMLDFGLTRTDGVVALGGGVVGDLAGFAAATVLRGVDFIQLPTTLLAQVDSSVGGKVAVDLRAGKNLAGAFWQPRLVLMDTDTLATLPDATFSDGMAEVVKYGCIWDKSFFDFLAARPTRAALTAEIESILYTCCEIKRQVVESDERDTGKRMLLNFGHTLGHAYELAGNYEKWTHGQAVAAGMVAAARLGVTLGVTPADVPAELEAVLAALDLPTAIPCDRATYAAAIGRDKKGVGEDISLILLESLGHGVIRKLPKAELLELL